MGVLVRVLGADRLRAKLVDESATAPLLVLLSGPDRIVIHGFARAQALRVAAAINHPEGDHEWP